MHSKNNGSLRRIRKKYQRKFDVLFSRPFREIFLGGSGTGWITGFIPEESAITKAFYLSGSRNLSGASGLLKPKIHLTDFPGVKSEATPSQRVEVNTLDSYQIKNTDFLVMDTQGYELEVLQGAQQTLTHIKWILFEYFKNEAYEKWVLETEIENFVEA